MTTNETRQLSGTVWTDILPGLLACFALAVGAMSLRQVSGWAVLSPMLVSVLSGVAVRWALGPDALPRAGLVMATRTVLRTGIVLLGLQITLTEIVDLGAGAFAVAALTLGATYLMMVLVGKLIGVAAPLSELIAAGTSVCGASAVVAANTVVRGTEADVGYAVACVTLFGTLAMLALPVFAGPLGLDPVAYGIWTGAGIHEVAQVTAAAFQLGPEAGQAGTITKLIRVMLLAPLVLALALSVRRPAAGSVVKGVQFPWFVAGFVALACTRELIDLPAKALAVTGVAATLCMSTGLAAMGLLMDLRDLRSRGIAPLALGAFGCVFVLGFALIAVMILL